MNRDEMFDALALQRRSLCDQLAGLSVEQWATPSLRTAPPFIGPIAPLSDAAVHALDIGRPLGLSPVHAGDAARAALDGLSRGLPGFNSRNQVRGLRYEANDLDWSAGDGPVVRGPAAALLLALAGRSVAYADLEGDGVPVLSGRMA